MSSRCAGRAMTLGLLGAVVLATAAVAFNVSGSFADLAQQRTDLEGKLEGLQERRIDGTRLEAEKLQLANDPLAASGMFDGSNPSEAADRFGARLQELSQSATGTDIGIENIQTVKSGDFLELVARAEFSAGTDSLDRLIAELGQSRPVLFIDEIRMRRVAPQNGAPATVALTAVVRAYAAVKDGGEQP